MDDVLRHLVRGWQGFVRLLAKATADGARLSPEDLARLERAQADLAEVIRRQKEPAG